MGAMRHTHAIADAYRIIPMEGGTALQFPFERGCRVPARVRGMEQVAAITRRLAAIAFADVVGWSRLVERNDVETLRAWKALRTDVLEPKFREDGGRLVETAGDAVLIEFPSAVGAVTWALETQRGLARPEGDGAAPRLALRIAINVEDVIVDENNLIADGVNI